MNKILKIINLAICAISTITYGLTQDADTKWGMMSIIAILCAIFFQREDEQ